MKVLAFGTFDHLHPGHIAYLREAAAKGDLFVIIARDANVESIKGRAPDQSETDRMEGVRNAFPDATVVLGDAENYLKPVKEIAPDLIIMGYDQELPPGITEEDLPCPVQKAKPFRPEEHKSSLKRSMSNEIDNPAS